MDVLKLAKYVILEAEKRNFPISNLQLQYVLYIIQRELLGNGFMSFCDYFQARRSGPVMPEVYCEYGYFAGMPIRQGLSQDPLRPFTIACSNDEKHIIDSIIAQVCTQQLNALALYKLACPVNGAWSEIWADGTGNRQNIPLDLVKNEWQLYCRQ